VNKIKKFTKEIIRAASVRSCVPVKSEYKLGYMVERNSAGDLSLGTLGRRAIWELGKPRRSRHIKDFRVKKKDKYIPRLPGVCGRKGRLI
jgi:hypothetical protein